MPYSFLTYGESRTRLAERLYDATSLFFSDTELGLYIKEALRTFNALANFYREEFTFNTQANVTWYDLTDSTNLPNTLRPFTVTDGSLIEIIEYHLLEPPTTSYPLVWAGSKQFTITDLLNAIQQMRDQMLSDSNVTITQRLINAPFFSRVIVPDTVVDIRRVCWLPQTGFGYTANLLMPSDIWAQQGFESDFLQSPQQPPLSYRRSTNPPLSFDVDLIPPVPGRYDLLTIDAQTALSISAASVLQIPDDFTWIVKWGAIAQLLGRESVQGDPLRAKYAMERYKHGIATLQTVPALLAARINDVPAAVEAISNGDFYRANWQGLTAGQPEDLYYAGLNLVGLAPIPDGSYSVLASVVRNMVMPTLDTSYLQVGRDDVSAILDYAQHLAMFKVGGAEFLESIPLLDKFLTHCQFYNKKLSAQSWYRELTEGLAKSDERVHPVTAGGREK